MLHKLSTSAATVLFAFGMASAHAQEEATIQEFVDVITTPCKAQDQGLDAFKECALNQILAALPHNPETGADGSVTLPIFALSSETIAAVEQAYNQTFPHPK